jgi:hypothetical protein
MTQLSGEHDKIFYIMNLKLKPFLDSSSQMSTSFEVSCDLNRKSTEIHLKLKVSGPLAEIDWGGPSVSPPSRGKDLWHKTCFELFIAEKNGLRYHEFNFSPEGQWDFFAFDNFRASSAAADAYARDFEVVVGPQKRDSTTFIANYSVLPAHGSFLHFLLGSAQFEFQIATILKPRAGDNLFFAVQHSSDTKPDFHERKAFSKFF